MELIASSIVCLWPIAAWIILLLNNSRLSVRLFDSNTSKLRNNSCCTKVRALYWLYTIVYPCIKRNRSELVGKQLFSATCMN